MALSVRVLRCRFNFALLHHGRRDGVSHFLGASLACPFRKRYPEIDLDYTRFKFPVLAFNFPVPSQKLPVPLSREFCSKSAESLDEWRPLSRELAQN
jgi:hypothetical protein